jgi:hypothetical protein
MLKNALRDALDAIDYDNYKKSVAGETRAGDREFESRRLDQLFAS